MDDWQFWAFAGGGALLGGISVAGLGYAGVAFEVSGSLIGLLSILGVLGLYANTSDSKQPSQEQIAKINEAIAYIGNSPGFTGEQQRFRDPDFKFRVYQATSEDTPWGKVGFFGERHNCIERSGDTHAGSYTRIHHCA